MLHHHRQSAARALAMLALNVAVFDLLPQARSLAGRWRSTLVLGLMFAAAVPHGLT